MNDTTAALGTLLPLAIGLALSPVPIVELILVLFSRRRTVNTIGCRGIVCVTPTPFGPHAGSEPRALVFLVR